MTCPKAVPQPQNYVPVCASVICEAPGVIYVSIDPDVWKIRCRQCQEKTEHKCALKKLKNKFRGDPTKRRQPRGSTGSDEMGVVGKKLKDGRGGGDDDDDEEEEDDGKGGKRKKGKGGKDGEDGVLGGKGKGGKGGKGGKEEGMGGEGGGSRSSMDPPEPIPDDYCPCADRPRDVPARPNVCLCEIYKPLNFLFELEVTGEFKPAFVPKPKKEKKHE